jgi:hypothetical protein
MKNLIFFFLLQISLLTGYSQEAFIPIESKHEQNSSFVSTTQPVNINHKKIKKDAKDWVTIMSEGFEGAFPNGLWTTLANTGYTDAYWDDSYCRYYSGGWAAYCAAEGSYAADCSVGENYPNNMKTWMIYGPFSLADATAAYLSFEYWLNCESYDNDYFFVGASIDGYQYWGPSYISGNYSYWSSIVVDLTDVYTLGNLCGTEEVWIGFEFISNGSITFPEGAYIDEIILQKNISGYQDLKVTSLSFSPDPVSENGTLNIYTTLENIGSALANSEIEYLLKDDYWGTYCYLGSDYVTLNPGEYCDQSITVDLGDIDCIELGYFDVQIWIPDEDEYWHLTNSDLLEITSGNYLYLSDCPTSNIYSGTGQFYFQISSDTYWTVTENSSWITCSPTNGNGSETVTVHYDSNPTSNTRHADISVTGAGITEDCSFNQEGIEQAFLNLLSCPPYDLPSSGGTFSMQVESNVYWDVNDDAGWVTCTPISGNGYNTVNVTYQQNTNPAARSCTVTISGDGESATCSITQHSNLGVNDQISAKSITIFPNPASDYIYIEKIANIKIESLSIYNSIGDKEKSITDPVFDDLTYYLPIHDLKDGVYLVQLVTNGEIITDRIIVKH